MYFNLKKKEQNDLLYESLENAIKDKRVVEWTAIKILGEETIPEEIHSVINEISTFTTERFIRKNSKDIADITSSLINIGKEKLNYTLKDPVRAARVLGALRQKYMDIDDKRKRARAEELGVFATILYTIKKCINWVVLKIQDLKDDFKDATMNKPEGYSRSKRYYNDVHKYSIRYLAPDASYLIEPDDPVLPPEPR